MEFTTFYITPMVHLIRDEIVCRRAVGLSQGYGIPQLGIIVLSSTSYHSLPSRDLFPFSTPFFAESLFAWLDLACCFQGDLGEMLNWPICDSIHAGDAGRPCNLAHSVRTILHRWRVKNFLCPISSTSISTCFCHLPQESVPDSLNPFRSLVPIGLPLLRIGSRFYLLRVHRMQHDLVDHLLRISLKSLAPVVTDCICKYCALS